MADESVVAWRKVLRRRTGNPKIAGLHSRSLRHASTILVGLCALLGASFALSACQPPGASLHGNVIDSTTNTARVGVPVTVYSDTSQTVVVSTVTDPQGDYSFPATMLTAGTYRVLFGTSNWWEGATDWTHATSVVLDGTTAVTINANFAVPSGSMSGTVYQDSIGGTPLAGATVTALALSNGQVVATTTTAADGTYSFASLPAASYTTQFSMTGLATHYIDGLSTPPANGQPVTAGQNTTVNSYLSVSATITGEATDGINWSSGLTVVAYDKTSGTAIASTTSDGNGAFSLTPLPAGSYEIGFIDPTGTRPQQLYGSATFDLSKGTTVTVAAGATATIDVALQGPDCSPAVFTPGANLSGMSFAGKNLGACDLVGDNLSGSNFMNASLVGSYMSGANVTNAVFAGSNFIDADLSNATGLNSTIVGLDQTKGLMSADLAYANLSGTGLNLDYINLSGKDLTGTNLSGTKLGYTNLSGAHLNQANLSNCPYLTIAVGLQSAYLTGTNLANNGNIFFNADLANKDLTGTNFTGDGFTNTTLDSANVTNAIFTGADLTNAWFTNVVGINTTIIGTDQSAGLLSAKLTQARFTGSGIDWSGLNLSGKDLTGAYLNGGNLASTNLSSANLTNTNLSGGNLTNANLTSANLTNTILAGTDFTNATLTGVTSSGITGTPAALPTGWTIVGGVLTFSG